MTDWTSWRNHIAQVIADDHQWIGLCDGYGRPKMTLPPVISMTAPETRMAVSSLDMQLNARGKIAPVHKVVDALIAKKLGVFDEEGRIAPTLTATHMIVIARPGSRRAFVASYSSALDGSESPKSVQPQATDLLDTLATCPCPSVPSTWQPNFQEWPGDAAAPYETPRVYAPIEMATAADGYTMDGPAESTIQTLIQDSLDAVNNLMGWSDYPHLVVDMASTGRPSPRVLIRTDDRPLWDTIVEPAQMAGVTITVDLWWPGDDPVLARPARSQLPVLTTWDRPIGVVRVRQIGVS